MEFSELERARQKYAQKVKIGWIIAAVLIAIVFVLMIIYFTTTSPRGFAPGVIVVGLVPGIFILATVAVVMMLLSRQDALNYKRAYKAYFVWRNLQRNFSDLHYNHEMGMARELIASTGMMRMGNIYSSNDLVLGQYKKVHLAQADVHIQYESTDSEGHTTYHTIFKGRWMIFEFPKKFNFRMMVATRNFAGAVVPLSYKTGKKMRKISVESPNFNKKFVVYGEDGLETFYLLDPAMIAKIENLAETYGKSFILCFMNNQLHVGLNDGRDSFEPPSSLRKIDPEVEDAKIQRDIKVITDLVDGLSLDKKLFAEK